MTFKQEKYSTDVFTIRQLEPNILETTILDRATLDVKDVWEAKKINTELSKGHPYAYLGVRGEFSEVTDQAKKLMASEEIIGNTIAKALLIKSLSDRILANFYLKISKPALKTRVFTSREKALVWLRSELKANQIN